MLSGLLIFGCALHAAPREEQTRDVQKIATLPAGRSLRLEHSNGDIHISATPGTELRIRAAIKCSARNATEARDCADAIQISVDESVTGVSVRTIYPRNWGRRNLSYATRYDITMPQNAPLDVRNRFGSVTVTGLHAPGVIHNGNGQVRFTGGRGTQRVENSFGDVDVETNDGDFSVTNHNGNVAIKGISGKVDVRNRFGATRVADAGRGLWINGGNGDINAVRIGGITNITNSFGRVTVIDAQGDVTVQNQNGAVLADGIIGAASLNTSFDRIQATRIGKGLTVRAQNTNVTADNVGQSAIIETTFGNADVRNVKGGVRVTAGNSPVRVVGAGGEVYVRSTFAGVDVLDVAGPITVENQNGHVMAELRSGRCQPIALSTSFSNIRLVIPTGIGYNVSARTSFGRIHSDHELTLSGGLSPESFTGRIGGGGCELRLTGQNGNIEILKGTATAGRR